MRERRGPEPGGPPWCLDPGARHDGWDLQAPARRSAPTLVASVIMGPLLGNVGRWWRQLAERSGRPRFREDRERDALTSHLELLSEHAGDVVMIVDASGFIVRANDGAMDYYGWSGQEMVGLDVRALRAPSCSKDFDDQLARIRREGRLRYETSHRRSGGTVFPVEVSARGFEVEGQWFFQAIVRDVSENKRILEALRVSEESLRATLESIGDGVIATDATGRVERMNPVAEELTGWTLTDARGHQLDEVLRIISEKTRQPIESPAVRVLRQGAGLGLANHTVLIARHGPERPVAYSAAPIRDRNGQPAGVVLVLRDATEERAAQRAQAHQAELLANLYDAVIALDAQHVIRTWNAAAERIYGVTSHEAIGRPISEILPSEFKGYSYLEFIEALDRSNRFRYEVRRRLRDGSWVDIEASAVVLRDDDGRITGYVTVNRDVTVRKRAEMALRASQERLARVLDTSNEAIWIVDVQGRTEFVNARAAEFFGAGQDEMLGRPILDFVPERGRPLAQEDMKSLARGDSIRREFVARRPDGSERWIEMSRSALRDPDGRVTGGVGVFMDVTEHRRAREQLLQAQKMDAVGRLASGIAHDFNNLLVVILSCSGYLIDSLSAGDPRRTDASEIKQAGERAASLVKQLLAFGRRSSFQPIPADLNTVVLGIEKLLRRTIGEDVVMSVSLASEPWSSRIDPSHFEQVLLNLVVNARDAMPAGGALRIRTSNATLTQAPPGCEGIPPGRYVVLAVSDEGGGIAPEVLPKIFEPFFTTKDEGRGTGLGLATVYGIVEQARGRIAVASQPGLGTTFTIYLPACDSAEREDAVVAEELRERVQGHGQAVLVVEDEEAVRRVARRMLEASGFRVLEAGGVAEALRRLQDDASVDVVLTDVIMPQGSGTDLEAAAAELRPNMPVVLMSGYSDWQRASARSGRVLVKPFTADALVTRIREALDSSRGAGGPHGCGSHPGQGA